jgi:hypothetical protein
MGEQLKEQTLYNSSEFNLKNLIWVDTYVSGTEGPTGTYASRRMRVEDFLNDLQGNLNFSTGEFTFKNTTGSTIDIGAICVIDNIDTGVITVKGFDRTEISLSQIYVSKEILLDGETGTFIQEGMISGIDTTGFSVGDVLFWDGSDLTTTQTSVTIFAGVVMASDVNGLIYFSPCNDYSIVKGSTGQVALFVGTDQIQSNSHFTFVDNAGTEVGYRVEDDLNNLLQIGVSYINLETEGSAQDNLFRMANWSNSYTNAISFRKARGTKASPTQVLNGDILGQILGAGQHDSGEGTTTFEAKIVAKNDYVIDNSTPWFLERNALTELQIWLASSIDGSITAPFPNNLVFSVDGDGVVKFKNYEFPIADGTAGQGLKTDGVGNLSWVNIIDGLFTYYGAGYGEIPFASASKSLTSVNYFYFITTQQLLRIGNNNGQDVQISADGIFLSRNSQIQEVRNVYSNTQNAKIILNRKRGSHTAELNLLLDDIIGQLLFQTNDGTSNAGVELRGRATEDHTTGSIGAELIFYITENGTSTKKIGLRLLNNGSVTINETYTLPNTDGSLGQVLVTDGAGNVNWGSSIKSFGSKIDGGIVSNTLTFDCENGITQLFDLQASTGDSNLVISNATEGVTYTLVVIQGSGAYDLTFPTGWWINDTAFDFTTLSNDERALVTLTYLDSTWYFSAKKLTNV